MTRWCTCCSLLFVSVQLLATAAAEDAKRSARMLIVWGSLDGALQDNGLPPSWKTYPAGFEGYDCYTVQGPYRSAPRSLRLAAEVPWASVIMPSQHPLERGTRQAGKGWVKVAGDTPGQPLLRIDYLDDAGKFLGQALPAILPADAPRGDDWKLLAVEGTADLYPQAARFQLVAALRGGGAVYWDDFELKAFPEASTTNLLKNPGFEWVTGDKFPGWNLFTTGPKLVTLQPTVERVHQGWVSARLAGEAQSAVLSAGRHPVVAGKSYYLVGWHRAARGTGNFKLVFWNGSEHVVTLRSATPAKNAWLETDTVNAAPIQFAGATHVTVEYETSGEFDLMLDTVRFWAEPENGQ